jgi:hypothetical protein
MRCSCRTPPPPTQPRRIWWFWPARAPMSARSLTVQVQLTDLQEMQNHMRETIDQGLQDLQAKQGTGGLPAAPPSAQAQPAPAQYAAVAPPPDPNVGAEIQQQDQQGDQAEKDVDHRRGAGQRRPGRRCSGSSRGARCNGHRGAGPDDRPGAVSSWAHPQGWRIWDPRSSTTTAA